MTGKRTRTGVGLIGCGNVSPRYGYGLRRFDQLDIVRCADVDLGRAQRAAQEYGALAGTTADLLDDPDVEIAVNLTPPAMHATTTIGALRAGKHVYVEKPLAVTLAEAADVLACMRATCRLVGSAPDTFLGSAGQTARAVIDSGRIGEPVGVTAFATHTWVEKWHPDPTFLFKAGGGPILDIGPYYVTALVNCLGPVLEVAGGTRIGAPKRTMLTEHSTVDTIEVEVPTHATAVLRFASGVLGTVLMSFDVWDKRGTFRPAIEIYGTDGSLMMPDPKDFDGDVRIKAPHHAEWELVPPVLESQGPPGGPEQLMRGLGVVDMVATLAGGPHRTSPELALHVLEVLDAVEASSRDHAVVRLTTTCTRPAPMVGA